MKRKPIVVALAALLLVGGAALWGVNYRLDHPPLTKADKEFRVLVVGADSMQLSYSSRLSYKPQRINLDAEQTRAFVENIRFFKATQFQEAYGLSTENGLYYLKFTQQNKELAHFQMCQELNWSTMYPVVPPYSQKVISGYMLHPRFDKRLNRALDTCLPHRIHP